LKRSVIKAVLSRLVWLGLFIFVGVLLANIMLATSTEQVNQKLNQFLPVQLSIGHVFYVPPHTLIFADTACVDPSRDTLPLRIDFLTLRFSLWDIVTQRTFSLRQVGVYRPTIHFEASRAFLGKYGDQIYAFIRKFPLGDFRLKVGDAVWQSSRISKPNQIMPTELDFRIHADRVGLNGWLGRPRRCWWKTVFDFSPVRTQRDSGGLDLKFRLTGQLQPRGLLVQGFSIKQKGLDARLWGEYFERRLMVNGFVLMKSGAARTVKKSSSGGKPAACPWTRNLFSASRVPFEPDIFILDIDGSFGIDFPQVVIEQCHFSANNMPMSLKGTLNMGTTPRFDGRLTLRPGAACEPGGPENFEKLEAVYRARFDLDHIRHAGEVHLYFTDNAESGLPLNKLSLALNDFRIRFDSSRNLNFAIPLTEVTLSTEKDERLITIRDIQAAFIFRTDRFQNVLIRSPFYSGRLSGRVWLDRASRPFRAISVLKFEDVDAHILESFLPYFTKVHGHLSSKVVIKSTPAFGIDGQMVIRAGRLNDLEFFKWLAESFSLPSLRSVAFERLAAGFFVTSEGKGLKNIRLKSKDVGLDGYFHVAPSQLVSSRIALSLSRRVLRESPRFTPLLRMFEKSVPSLIFDFQLSGDLENMNFKWLQSHFKRRIRQRIPDFIERKIQHGIEAILKPDQDVQFPSETSAE